MRCRPLRTEARGLAHEAFLFVLVCFVLWKYRANPTYPAVVWPQVVVWKDFVFDLIHLMTSLDPDLAFLTPKMSGDS